MKLGEPLPQAHFAGYASRLSQVLAEASWSGELEAYDAALRESFVWRDLRAVRNTRQAFGAGFWRGSALAGLATVTGGRMPFGDLETERDADQELLEDAEPRAYPAPDGELTFDKLSSVYLSGNRTRDDQPNHIRLQTRVPRALGELWVNMCPAQVYELGGGGEGEGEGEVEVQIVPSNCVQCGAISAKGGRLTPPEGGSGPEYKLT